MKLAELKIAIIGLGYVGLPLAVEFGKKKVPVVGFDISSKRIEELKNGQDHTLEVSPIELNSTRFNYNFDRDTKINQSLIKLFGLGKGKDYFLYQVATPVDYAMNKTPINFTIFSELSTSPNGSKLTKTSMKMATHQSFKLNGLIPDYEAGANEYNILSVTPQKEIHFSAVKSIIFPLLLLVLGIMVIGVILVRIV